MASLKSGTTIGTYTAIHTNNISSYALTSVPSNVITTSGGQTIAGITYFSNGESLSLYGIRGRFTNEYIHLYNKVGIGHPSGWGQGEGNTPNQGLSTYGGINVSYGNGADSTFNGKVNILGSSMYVTASQLHIGKASSGTAQMSFESWGSYTGAIAMNASGQFHWGGQGASEWYFKTYSTYNGDYSASGNTAARIASDGNIWMSWAGDWLSNLLGAKQNASTAITTSNIGSQSVNYASSAGNADTVDGRHADYFYPGSTDNGYSTGDIYGSGTHQRLWGTDSVQNLLAFRPPTSIEYSTDGTNWTATTATNGLWDNKMFGKWGGFTMAVGNNIGAWRFVRMTWVNFGYHFFSHFTLAHSTNGHSFNFVFQKSDLNGVFSGEAFRQNGINSWPGYTFTKHSNVSGWWDTRDIRFVFELNHNNDFPNNGISIGHIGLMGGYSGFTRLYDWDGDRKVYFSNEIHTTKLVDANNNTYYFDGDSLTSLRTRGSWRADSSDWDGEYSGKIQYHSGHWYFQAGDRWYFRNASGSNVFEVTQAGNVYPNGEVVAPTLKARKAQSDNNYTTAALWTESYSTTTTGLAFHISGVVGKFLEMRTNGILYWDNNTVIHTGNIASQSVSYADESGYSASSGSVEWTSVQNKPATFTPSSHTHDDRYYTESESDNRYVPYGSITGSFGLNDNKLYLRTNGDNNHYLWNAGDDWEELVYFTGTGFRVKGSTGVTAATFTDSGLGLTGDIVFPNDSSAGLRNAAANAGIRLDDQWGNMYSYNFGGGYYVDATSYFFRSSASSNWMTISGGTVQASGDFRAPIFYDSADTGYYLDPNSTSYLYHLVLSGNSYFRPNNWIQFDGNYGVYWPNHYGLHLYPNTDGSYGSLQVKGIKNSWHGIHFDSGSTLMMNSGETGVHRQGVGWQWRWYNGEMYISAGSTGGGTERTVIHSGNIGSQSVSYATSAGDSTNLGGRSSSRYLYYRGVSSSGDFQSFQSSESIIRFDQVNDYNGLSNPPGGYTYGGVLSMRGDNFGFQLWGSHTGNFYFKTQWNNDQYSGWREVIHSANIGSYALTSLPSHNHDDRYLVKGGGWYGVGLPGSRWGGFSVSGGEIVFGDGLPNAGQMGILIDGAYLAGENNGFWSLASDNSWSSRRGMYWDGTYLNFTTNTPPAIFSDVRAPIFYDSNDTTYYGDFASTSWLRHLSVGDVNASNDGGWNARLNLTGSYHARLDVKSNSDGIITTMYSHTGQGVGRVGTMSNHPLAFMVNGNVAGYAYANYLQGVDSVRAPIFYDSQDTGYYLDPNGSSNLNAVTANQYYANGWFRNYSTNGLYNESYGNHWYATSNATWNAAGNNGSYVEIAMRTGGHQGSIRGYFYADSSANIGILNNAGNWSLLTNSSRNTTLYGQLTVGEGIGYSSIFMTDSDEGTREIHCNSNRIGFLNQSSSWGSWCYDDGSWATGVAMYSPIYYDSADSGYYLDPNADLSLKVYGEICNSNYQAGRLQPGALNIGRTDTNYAWDGGTWADDVRLGILANTNETWEFGIHDSGDSVMSVVHFDGGSTLTMGRNLGWGQCVVNAPAGYVSNSNPWGTANSAYFPNGITTAGSANWIYGTTTYIGNAPSNGSGHDFSSSGHQYSTGSITTPLFLVNNHSDNTKGYRIHNTSGSSVSAMFVNSSNQLVIAAGAVDQINLNKKVYVNGVALGVNVAPSATAGRIDASNDIVAYSSSDERLKYNIAPIENALDKVKSLTGVEFDWKPEYKHAHGYEGHDTGIIAQQVEAVMPSAVRTNDTGFLAVRYEKLIGLLIEANKELAARVEELEKKLG